MTSSSNPAVQVVDKCLQLFLFFGPFGPNESFQYFNFFFFCFDCIVQCFVGAGVAWLIVPTAHAPHSSHATAQIKSATKKPACLAGSKIIQL